MNRLPVAFSHTEKRQAPLISAVFDLLDCPHGGRGQAPARPGILCDWAHLQSPLLDNKVPTT